MSYVPAAAAAAGDTTRATCSSSSYITRFNGPRQRPDAASTTVHMGLQASSTFHVGWWLSSSRRVSSKLFHRTRLIQAETDHATDRTLYSVGHRDFGVAAARICVNSLLLTVTRCNCQQKRLKTHLFYCFFPSSLLLV